jgi:hypothetical protein
MKRAVEDLTKLWTFTKWYGYEFVAFSRHNGTASLVYISGTEVAGR